MTRKNNVREAAGLVKLAIHNGSVFIPRPMVEEMVEIEENERLTVKKVDNIVRKAWKNVQTEYEIESNKLLYWSLDGTAGVWILYVDPDEWASIPTTDEEQH